MRQVELDDPGCREGDVLAQLVEDLLPKLRLTEKARNVDQAAIGRRELEVEHVEVR